MIAITRSEAWDVTNRLAELDLSKDTLIEIVKACVAGQGGCTENDPPNAAGYESYRLGTRRARELLRGHGWTKDDSGNYCSVVNHAKRFKLVVMNADEGAGLGNRVPQNRCRKGPSSARAANVNQRSLFESADVPLPPTDGPPPSVDGYATWHLCVFSSGQLVRAELSMLNQFEDGYFTGVFEKIIILGEGDWEKVTGIDGPDADDDGSEFDVEVKRK